MRQLLAGHCIRRVAMCALSSIKGKRQHLCVNHDKGKVREGGSDSLEPDMVKTPYYIL